MKVKYFIFLLVVSLSSFLNGQNIITNKLAEENAQNGEGSIIDARPVLERLSKAAGIDLDKIEPIPPQLRKTAWTFNVDSPGPYSNGWWAHDLSGSTIGFYTTPATCRAVGTNCYIFVENTVWDNGRVNQNAVNKVMEAFDTKNALSNSTKGIYQTNVEYFGNPPNVDNDPRIIILILDIKDNYATNPSEGSIAGYFYSYNQGNASNSNKAEVFYLDANPLNLTTDAGIYSGMSITAHEFQHMIHWNYTPPSSQTFFNESFSEIASYLNGYNLRSTSLYSNSTNVYTIGWNSTLTDYARAARFSLYLYEQFSGGIFKQYLQNRIFDENGIKFAAQAFDPGRDFESILEDWFIANYLNNRNYNTRYGYLLANQTKAASTVYTNPNVSLTTGGVSKYGVQYITYKGGKNLTINFNSNGNASLKVKAIKIGSSNIQVENVPTNTNVNFSDYGTTFTEITFAVFYTSLSHPLGFDPSSSKFNFSYSSTGTAENFVTELKYDDADTKAVLGAFSLSVNDTIAVLFNGMSGTKLQKIKIGLRNTLSITGRIYRSTVFTSRPLGAPISNEFTLTGTTTPTSPFPVPWPNMVELDLSSQNIDASQNFAVAFFYKGTSGNNIVVTARSPVEYYYSLTYLNSPSSGSPGWYYLRSSDTEVGLYVIRAFVGTGTVGINDEFELLPASFSIDQNYPNPFNPETVISFSLPKSSNVQIKIYDVLGNEIRTLIDEARIAGKHNIYWNATDNSGKRVSSGVYFYTISADNFTQTKKMVLMK